MEDIKDRSDVNMLVRAFYSKVQQDYALALVFNRLLPSPEIWEHHLVKLVDFWDTNLFGAANYSGNPMGQHLWVDSQTGRKIKKSHFEKWLQLWGLTIDEMFAGPVSKLAKDRAASMGDTFYNRMLKVREDIKKRSS